MSHRSRTLLGAEKVLALSTMSILEVAQKHHKGKLLLPLPLVQWIAGSLPAGRIELLPMTREIALRAYDRTPDLHGDPGDRIIGATALEHNLVLVTCDEKLLARSDLLTLDTR